MSPRSEAGDWMLVCLPDTRPITMGYWESGRWAITNTEDAESSNSHYITTLTRNPSFSSGHTGADTDNQTN